MRTDGLNRWQRIGIVLSVFWAVGAAIYEFDAIQRRDHAAFSAAFNTANNQCQAIQDSRPTNGIACSVEAGRIANAVPKESLWNIAVASLVPILIAWLNAYVLLVLVRWIRAGFKRST